MDHNRELDKKMAKAIGCYVMQVQGTHYFCLMKPHRRTLALGSLRGDGPERLVPGKATRSISLNENDAWEWVPHFTTNQAHTDELSNHMYLICNIPMPNVILSLVELVEYYIAKVTRQ